MHAFLCSVIYVLNVHCILYYITIFACSIFYVQWFNL